MREVCAALYASLNALSLSAGVDVCAHVCPYDGGRWGAWGWVARAGIKHARSTSQRLGGPSPALTATHVKPRLHGKKKWVSGTQRTRAHIEYTRVRQYQLKESQSASRASALLPVCDPRSARRHAHLPAEQTRPLDRNNGIKIGAKKIKKSRGWGVLRDGNPSPSLTDPLPHLPL